MSSKTDDVVKKLLELNKLIKSLDPSIRQQSFDLLKPLFFESIPSNDEESISDGKQDVQKKVVNTNSIESFFKSFDHKKPSDNVFLIAAWLYSQYGVISISSEHIKSVADDTGLTVPGRPDMTLKAATKSGKHLFKKQDAGFKPTVHGEAYLKDTYHIKKGSLPFSKENEK